MESVVGEKQTEKAVEILLVEDNPGDVHLTLAALNRTPISNRVHVVGDGEAAIRFPCVVATATTRPSDPT